MTKSKTHQSELERLASLEQRAESGGGQKAIDRQHERGKLTAWERLNLPQFTDKKSAASWTKP
jgi:acetyl-CoA carboxylase carboxyltransferase component